jgi:hypothetical protein
MRQAIERVLELDQTEGGYEESGPLRTEVAPESSVLLRQPPRPTVHGVIVGILTGFEETGTPLVTFREHSKGAPLAARSTVELLSRDIGCEVAVMFEKEDLTKPIILGCIRPPLPGQREGRPGATLDGERIVLSAEREIVLRCGKSSITLTRAGKVIIRGAYLLSRSSGVNRIKGGSVQIN